MKKISLIAFVAACFSLAAFSSGFCADVAKIGVIDFQKIMDTSSAGKLIRTQISENKKKAEKKLTEEGTAIRQMERAFERERLVLSDEKRVEKQREIRNRKEDFDGLTKKETIALRKFAGQLQNKLLKEIFGIVEEIGKSEDYLIILERQKGGAVYFPSHIDITDRVIDIHNKKTASAKK